MNSWKTPQLIPEMARSFSGETAPVKDDQRTDMLGSFGSRWPPCLGRSHADFLCNIYILYIGQVQVGTTTDN